MLAPPPVVPNAPNADTSTCLQFGCEGNDQLATGIENFFKDAASGFMFLVEKLITTEDSGANPTTLPVAEPIDSSTESKPEFVDTSPLGFPAQDQDKGSGSFTPAIPGQPSNTGDFGGAGQVDFDPVMRSENGEKRNNITNKGVADLLADPKFQEDLRDVNCVDCDDIARRLLKASGGQGEILDLTVPGGSIKVEEFGRIENFVDHRVFSDGKNIIDPRLSNKPIPINEYMNNLRKLNPNLRIRDVTP